MLKTETSKKRVALGQGLDALIPLDHPMGRNIAEKDIKHVPIETLVPNPFQPRRSFTEESLLDLSRSIKEMGVIQPLIVRSTFNGNYEIVAGERRWKAAKMAGFSTVPVIIRNVSDSESLEIALIENLQREDLNPIDTAEAYDILIKKFSYTHENVAKRIGKDRTSITNHLRLLKLPEPIKEEIRGERLSFGHARTLLAIDDLNLQLRLSRKAIQRNLSVRDLEKIVQNYKEKKQSGQVARIPTLSEFTHLEKQLSRYFSTKVTIRKKADNSGKIEFHFHSQEELDRLLEAMGYSEDFS